MLRLPAVLEGVLVVWGAMAGGLRLEDYTDCWRSSGSWCRWSGVLQLGVWGVWEVTLGHRGVSLAGLGVGGALWAALGCIWELSGVWGPPWGAFGGSWGMWGVTLGRLGCHGGAC